MTGWKGLPPLLPLALMSLVGVTIAEWGWGWLVLLVVTAMGAYYSGRGAWACAAVVGLFLGGLHCYRMEERQSLRELLQKGHEVQVRGVLTRTEGEGLRPAIVKVQEVVLPVLGVSRAKGMVVVRGLPEEWLPGDRVVVRGALDDEGKVRNPGERSGQMALWGQGFAGMLWSREHHRGEQWEKCLVLWRLAEVLRRNVLQRLGAGGADDRGERLLRALVLGERTGGEIGEQDFEPFRLSGTMHIFAVSGLHVGMVGLMAWWLLGHLRVRRLSALGFLLVMGAMATYAMATGLRPPALRALLMATVYLGGGLLRRKAWGLNALFAAVPVVLAMDTHDYKQAGFQLSFLVVGVMTTCVPFVWRRVSPWCLLDRYIPRQLYTPLQETIVGARQWLGGLAVVSLVAWLGSAPLAAWHFGIITPVAVLGGVMLVPLAFMMLGLAFAGLSLGLLLPAAGEALISTDKRLAVQAHELAGWLHTIPGSHFELSNRIPWRNGLIVLSGQEASGASHVDAGGGLLIDGGSSRDFLGRYNTMRRRMRFSADSYVVTHADSLHTGGLLEWSHRQPSRQALVPVGGGRSTSYRELREFVKANGGSWLRGKEGALYPIGKKVKLTVLHDGRKKTTGGTADDSCLVVRLDWNGWRILYTGDAGYSTERYLLESGADIDCDVWVTGYHEDDLTGTTEFVRAASPSAIIVSEGSFPGERFSLTWKEWVRSQGIRLYLLEESGAVTILPRRKELVLKPYLQPDRQLKLRR